MGQARQKKLQARQARVYVLPAVEKVGAAIRKLATAASEHLGNDCYIHAAIGQALLADLGVKTKLVAGYAAWRVGRGDGDVIAHVSHVKGYLPDGTNGFAYHVWLETVEEAGGAPLLIDFTTYQLPRKASELDAADGGKTGVEWHPDLMVLRRNEINSYQNVAKAPGPGLTHYEAVPAILNRLQATEQVDPEDLRLAKLIMSNPEMLVSGPNQMREAVVAGKIIRKD